MSKEIEALKNLIAAMDAEEEARRVMEKHSDDLRYQPFDIAKASVLSGPHSKAIEDWAKAFNDLAAARGIAKHLIREAGGSP